MTQGWDSWEKGSSEVSPARSSSHLEAPSWWQTWGSWAQHRVLLGEGNSDGAQGVWGAERLSTGARLLSHRVKFCRPQSSCRAEDHWAPTSQGRRLANHMDSSVDPERVTAVKGINQSWSKGCPRSLSTTSCKRRKLYHKQINFLPEQIQHSLKESYKITRQQAAGKCDLQPGENRSIAASHQIRKSAQTGKRLNVRAEIMKLLAENTGINLQDLDFGNGHFNKNIQFI